jgi:small-conductance mechanosensitive channel
MRVGVPLLLVNLFTLLVSFILLGFFISEFLGVQLAPLLATSAFISVVLGLALQDTLGNLFAGIALQIDKAFSIGDWLEVSGPQKYIGQVYEISWRATILEGFTEELITIPNRIMAQSEISNFSMKGRPFIRSQVLRIPFTADYENLRIVLKAAALDSKAVRTYPEPLVIFTETTESWVTAKLVYYIDDYGAQFLIADKVVSQVLTALNDKGFKLASSRIEVIHPPMMALGTNENATANNVSP